ncbi:hypothetical protein QFC22_004650 [Naganishia vaughanmartiniae]|uniref:Uncharacterized protein n=1 Tax=Naganishia vaughanmartiniae TaxID=1424756 RepID=A0ACC2WZC9_9TREE|nr:hypothetical protein QFC22_004650 [Naganishia vaughanmartiniae]
MSPMPTIRLSDGVQVPVLGYGTGTAIYQKDAKDSVIMAVSRGNMLHIDCAEMYLNEESVGSALKELKVEQGDLFLTSKCGLENTFISKPSESLERSLQKAVKGMGLSSAWKMMEQLLKEGKTRSIGVSNHRIEFLEEILKNAKTLPSVNQIEVHPYVYDKAQPIIEFCASNAITIEAYGTLASLIHYPGGPVDPIVQQIARDLGATESQVLLKWAHQITHGGPVVTTSNKSERLEEHIKALTEMGDLSDTQMQAIVEGGKQNPQRFRMEDMNER